MCPQFQFSSKNYTIMMNILKEESYFEYSFYFIPGQDIYITMK